MNIVMKAVYYCATSRRTWGKGLTMLEAMKNAGVTSFKPKNVDFYVTSAIFDNPSDEELENMRRCITSNPFDGNAQYYTDDRTEADSDMISRLHVGWLMIYKTAGVK